MTKKTQAVLFDLDGTLVDTAPDFIVALNDLRNIHKLEPLEPSAIRAHVSDGARALTHLAFGGAEGETLFEELKAQLLELYLDIAGEQCVLFSGFDKVLANLEERKIPWGIVTNKPRVYTDQILKRMSLVDRCSIAICPDELKNSKPDPEGLLKAATSLGVKAEYCVYVGDHQRDIQAGQRANMSTIGVSFGYLKHPSDAHTWGANFVIDTPVEILNLL